LSFGRSRFAGRIFLLIAVFLPLAQRGSTIRGSLIHSLVTASWDSAQVTPIPDRLNVMIERTIPQKDLPVPLTVGAGQRIVTLGMEPVLGWIGSQSARIAQPLTFPPGLLEPCASTTIAYTCNLPAPLPAGKGAGSAPESGQTAALAGVIAREAEASFLASSLPGGQVSIVSAGGCRAAIGLRWVCVTGHASIGAVWRCFLKLHAPAGNGLWTAAGHDYVFEANGGWLLNAPGSLSVALGDRSFTLTHPGGLLTCFPAQSALVKVVRLYADGWAKRELKSIMRHADRSIVAHFSDGSQKCIAIAAPGRAAAAMAA
jgi:hypothetical protein